MRRLLAGIDLGGTSVKVALSETTGEVLIQDSMPTDSHTGPDGVMDRIEEFLTTLADRADGKISAIGMGVPGLVDLKTGSTKFLPNMTTQWRDVPVGQRLTEKFGCPVRLLNDVRTATLGEVRFGHGRENPTVTLAFFALGTGVGGGVAIDGKVRLGSLGAAGELGHQTILPDGPRCGCGNFGCLEVLASGPAISAEGMRLLRTGLAPRLHDLVEGDADRITTREMHAAAQAGDERVREVLIRAATYVGLAAADVVTILHPDLIILGGGVAEMGDILVSTVDKVIRERVGMFPTDDVTVTTSMLGEKAGVMGALALASDALNQKVS